MTDHYSTLGISALASLEQIHEAYRPKLHAHLAAGGKEDDAQPDWAKVRETYGVLSHQQLRLQYDQQRRDWEKKEKGKPYGSDLDATSPEDLKAAPPGEAITAEEFWAE